MSGKHGFHFDSRLIKYIECDRVDEVKSMLNDDLAKASDDFNDTLLHYAVLKNSDAVVEYLIELGAEIDCPGKDDKTPLMLAVERVDRSTVDFMDAVDNTGNNRITVIKMAFESNCRSIKILEILLRRLQSVSVDIDELIDKMIAAGCNLSHCTTSLKDAGLIQCMLQRGFDVNSRDSDGRTSLHLAAIHNEAELAKLLIDHGADVDDEYDGGRSPLIAAACNGSKETMKILLEGGANPNATYNELNFIAILMIFTNFKNVANEVTDECLELLFQHGAFPQNPSQLFDIATKKNDLKKIYILTNYLVLLKELGKPIADSDFYCNDERSNWSIPLLINACQEFLKDVVFRKLTMLDLLKDGQDKMRTHVRNNNAMSKLQQLLLDYEDKIVFPCYCSTLTKRIYKAVAMVKLEDTAIPILCKLFRRSYNQCYYFARDIVGCLSEKDLEQLCRV